MKIFVKTFQLGLYKLKTNKKQPVTKKKVFFEGLPLRLFVESHHLMLEFMIPLSFFV